MSRLYRQIQVCLACHAARRGAIIDIHSRLVVRSQLLKNWGAAACFVCEGLWGCLWRFTSRRLVGLHHRFLVWPSFGLVPLGVYVL